MVNYSCLLSISQICHAVSYTWLLMLMYVVTDVFNISDFKLHFISFFKKIRPHYITLPENSILVQALYQ